MLTPTTPHTDFRTLVDQAPVGVVISRDGRIDYANPAAARLFGYTSPLELQGRSALDIVAQSDRKLVEGRMRARARREDVPGSYEFRSLRADGSEGRCRVEAALTMLDDGPALVGYLFDLSTDPETEAERRTRAQRFRELADDAPVLVRVADAVGETTYFNAQWYELTGQDEGSSLGQGWLEAVHPDDRSDVRAAFARAIADNAPLQIEYRLRDKTGAHRWCIETATPHLGGRNQPDGFVGSIVDIHTKKEAELCALRLAALVEQSDDAIVSKTTDGTILSWNSAAVRIFGYSSEEMLGASIFRLVPPELHGEETVILGRLAAGERIERYKTERIRKSGARVQVELSVAPVRDGSGHISGAVAIKRDVSEQIRHEERNRQSAKMAAIGRLAGGLAHDFNNQLHAVLGFASFVAADPGLSREARSDLRQIETAAERMSSLTRQLLAFSRQQVLTLEVLDLVATVRETQPMLQRLLGSNLEVRVEETGTGALWVRADRAQLLQVLMNLVINARDAMPDGGKIVVRNGIRQLEPGEVVHAEHSTLVPGEYVWLSVTDSGTGIAPENIPYIYEPFFTTKPVGRGTGLGLPTVHGIITQSRGGIAVDTVPGQGTTFTVYLPSASAEAPSPPVAAEPFAQSPALPALKVLVVEDEPIVRKLLDRILTLSGFEVVQASHGGEALSRLHERRGDVDLIVSDVVMPVMGGAELATHLATSYPTLPVIWMSGHPREIAFATQRINEAQPYLQKPVSPDTLLDTIRQLLPRAKTTPLGR